MTFLQVDEWRDTFSSLSLPHTHSEFRIQFILSTLSAHFIYHRIHWWRCCCFAFVISRENSQNVSFPHFTTFYLFLCELTLCCYIARFVCHFSQFDAKEQIKLKWMHGKYEDKVAKCTCPVNEICAMRYILIKTE